jgi:hypothetical protein
VLIIHIFLHRTCETSVVCIGRLITGASDKDTLEPFRLSEAAWDEGGRCRAHRSLAPLSCHGHGSLFESAYDGGCNRQWYVQTIDDPGFVVVCS